MMKEIKNLTLNSRDLIQSKYLDLLASGSDGVDGSTKGVHLRWSLQGDLGANHLPKGKLANPGETYATTVGYSRNDDFVELYKVPYIKKYPLKIDLENASIDSVDTEGATIVWSFEVDVEGLVHTSTTRTVKVVFEKDKYEVAVAGKNVNVSADRIDFLKAYSGIINYNVGEVLSFAAGVTLKHDGSANDANMRIETISTQENSPEGREEPYLSIRKTGVLPSAQSPETHIPIVDENVILQPNGTGVFPLMNENITSVRFDYTNGHPIELTLETYDDYIVGVSGEPDGWQGIGEHDGFALSYDKDSDAVVFDRLGRTGVDGNWPRFRESEHPTTGGATSYKTVTENYEKKWLASMKNGVKSYLDLSRDAANLKAIQTVGEDENELQQPVLDSLNLAALDYNVARMLGLGYVDNTGFSGDEEGTRYIYLIKYLTTVELGGFDVDLTHYAMSLPLGAQDNYLPETPELKDFTFGFDPIQDDLIVPRDICDENGYTKAGRGHVININVEQQVADLDLKSFFFASEDYHFLPSSFPTFYGIEIKGEDLGGALEAHYRDPKLLNDKVYNDGNNNNEVIPILNPFKDTVYRHVQTESGKHAYAVYGINAFNRISPLSVEKEVTTTFPKRNKLIAPANVSGTIIQEEVPRIISSQIEQNLKAQIAGSDKTLVRVLFDVNQIHFGNYIYGDKVQWFHRDAEPGTIQGKIKTLNANLPNSDEFEIETESMVYTSQEPVEILDPTITDTIVTNECFVDGYLATPQGRFRIIQVTKNTDDTAIIRMKKLVKEDVKQNPDKTFGVSQSPLMPLVGEQFLAIENLKKDACWDNQLAKEIDVINHSPYEVTSMGTSTNITTNVVSVQPYGAATRVYVEPTLTAAGLGGELAYTTILGVDYVMSDSDIVLDGDREAMFTGVTKLTVQNSKISDGLYTIMSADYNPDEDETVVSVSRDSGGGLSLTDDKFAITFLQKADILEVDAVKNCFVVKGELENEILGTYTEVNYNFEGTPSLRPMGGLVDTATIQPIIDEVGVDANGNELPSPQMMHLGRYIITFNNKDLAEHPDADVEWYRGNIRIPNEDFSAWKQLKVLAILRDPALATPTAIGPIDSPLKLIVEDSTHNSADEGSIILNPSSAAEYRFNVPVNFHPGYRAYFYTEASKLDDSTLRPAPGERERITWLGGRVIDSYAIAEGLNCVSEVSSPAKLSAIYVDPPVVPGIPAGAIFATRPDKYVKSTYTFDVDFDRAPYGVIFYRSNTKSMLSLLYKKETLETVWDKIVEIRQNDFANQTTHFTGLMHTLMGDGVGNDATDTFITLSTDGVNTFNSYEDPLNPGTEIYRFPNPDNNETFIPNADPLAELFHPFPENGADLPATVTHTIHASSKHKKRTFSFTKAEIIRKVLNNAFIPLTENPVRYSYLKEAKETSSRKPVFRDENGQALKPTDPEFDAHPMAVLVDGPGSVKSVRFTDYNLDGASNEAFFYFGMGIGNMGDTSQGGPIAGPILLTNAAPPPKPVVRKVRSVMEDPSAGVKPAIDFAMNRYSSEQRIKGVKLYRTTDPQRALSVRNMEEVMEIPVDTTNVIMEFKDEFVNDTTPLFGDLIFYRMVAIREIVNEVGEKEDIPSEPSDVMMTNLVDVVNPLAPTIKTTSGSSSSTQLFDVKLQWKKTVHNGTYRIYKMNDSGNWEKLDEIHRNNDAVVEYTLTDPLSLFDGDGNAVYHRFKVDVENSSGLLNLEEKSITMVTGANDLFQQLEDVVELTDATSTISPLVDTIVDPSNEYPTSFTIKDVMGSVPAGHIFEKIEVTIEDSLGGTATDEITALGGEVTFTQASGIQVDNTQLNIAYTITAKVFTDLVPNGAAFTYEVQYGPCNALIGLTDIVKLTDTNGADVNPLVTGTVDEGVNHPGSITVQDILTVPAGQVYTKTEVTISDDFGNEHTLDITSVGGSVTFNHGDGGLELNADNPNRTYYIEAKVITDKCDGYAYNYTLSYTYDPAIVLLALSDIASFADGSANTVNPLVNTSFDTSTNPGGSITITDVMSTPLPDGHTFSSMTVEVSDGTNVEEQIIGAQGGNVVFNATTAPSLDLTTANLNYSVSITLFTDKAVDGASFFYSVSYDG